MHVIRSPIVYISIQASKKYKYERSEPRRELFVGASYPVKREDKYVFGPPPPL